MMATEIYGMMPSAKIEKRSNAPPENRLTHPNSVLEAASKNAASACPSIPGVGTATPIRYTASIAAVKSSRRRSSGIREAFEKPSSIRPVSSPDQLEFATRGSDFPFRTFRECMGAYRNFTLQFTVAQHLNLTSGSYQATIRHQGRVDLFTVGESRQPADIDFGELIAARGVLEQPPEATFGNPPLQRHLATLISRGRISAVARAASLMATASRFSVPRADAASDPLLLMSRTGGRLQFA